VVQNQQRLAKVGNEIVRVENHPEDHVPTVMERFEALALQQQKESGTKPKRHSKDRDTEERSTTPRRSSRNKKTNRDLSGWTQLHADLQQSQRLCRLL
jgi:hypothetical protein